MLDQQISQQDALNILEYLRSTEKWTLLTISPKSISINKGDKYRYK
jgi:hypothetical protein